MALFGKKTEKKDAEKAVATAALGSSSLTRDLSRVIIRPLITEKAAVLGDKNVYTFEIHSNATKTDVRDAVKTIFKVTPMKIRTVRSKLLKKGHPKMRGTKSIRAGMKKAYVYLKAGDRIDLV